jgi:hypothetical protein
VIRTHLRARGIGIVIPEPDDQKPTRKRRGSRVCVHRTQCYCHRLEHEDMGMMANFEVV